MAVKRPFAKPIEKSINIEELIGKGALVKEDSLAQSQEEKKWTHINLRIPKDMLKHIDSLLEERVGITRTGWILEALQEKMKRLDQ